MEKQKNDQVRPWILHLDNFLLVVAFLSFLVTMALRFVDVLEPGDTSPYLLKATFGIGMTVAILQFRAVLRERD